MKNPVILLRCHWGLVFKCSFLCTEGKDHAVIGYEGRAVDYTLGKDEVKHLL